MWHSFHDIAINMWELTWHNGENFYFVDAAYERGRGI